MNAKLNGITVWPGVIGSERSSSVAGWLIGSTLGKSYKALTGNPAFMCPSHNFIIVEHADRIWIGESVHPKAKLTPFIEYERKLAAGEIRNLQLFEVHEIDRPRQALAALWWVENVLGHKYDWPAFFRLSLKAVFGDWFPQAAGCSWKWWCTEGIKDAFAKRACWNFYANENPTPYTTIKRWQEGRLRLMEANDAN